MGVQMIHRHHSPPWPLEKNKMVIEESRTETT